MKTSPTLLLLVFQSTCIVTPLTAQIISDQELLPSAILAYQNAVSVVTDPEPLCVVKNSPTLDTRLNTTTRIDSAIDLDVLRQPSIYKVGTKDPPATAEAALRENLTLLSAAYRVTGRSIEAKDSAEVILSVSQKIKLDPAQLLEIVESEITANPSYACEIIRAAIQTTEAEPSLTVKIVEKAIRAAPEAMRLISQCAIAAAPESLPAIQVLLAEMDPNGGESDPDSKSSKSAKSIVAAVDSESQHAMKPDLLDLLPTEPMPPGPILPPLVTNADP